VKKLLPEIPERRIFMRNCRSIKGLIFAMSRGSPATLIVYGSRHPASAAGIWGSVPDSDSLTLNVFPGHIRYCSPKTYERIKDHLTILPAPCPEGHS